MEARQGLKAIELVVEGSRERIFLSSDAIEEAVLTGDIVEIEYIVPNMPGRIKSFLLPKGAIINRIRNG